MIFTLMFSSAAVSCTSGRGDEDRDERRGAEPGDRVCGRPDAR